MLDLNEVDSILERTKLRLLIQEKSKLAGADTLDSVVLLRNGRILILLLLEKEPKKKDLINTKCSDLEFWFMWKDKDKVYVQKAGDKDVIPLELGEVDAFIDLVLQ
ncbi:hypothetical protein [Thermococcus sibiricus]|uniref:Uncharacterized protein n=1 Tax=Thermococcus sibiricus (strain DSM 12597 / MM 739) TaxID=604354 RepID=C6A0C3_THESM|nr:hypothetical protein [Thermococcus sibiricus]ACS91104.1 hypothetical protein TSIB_2057 [Thermococcus sibiricus MM 739]